MDALERGRVVVRQDQRQADRPVADRPDGQRQGGAAGPAAGELDRRRPRPGPRTRPPAPSIPASQRLSRRWRPRAAAPARSRSGASTRPAPRPSGAATLRPAPQVGLRHPVLARARSAGAPQPLVHKADGRVSCPKGARCDSRSSPDRSRDGRARHRRGQRHGPGHRPPVRGRRRPGGRRRPRRRRRARGGRRDHRRRRRGARLSSATCATRPRSTARRRRRRPVRRHRHPREQRRCVDPGGGRAPRRVRGRRGSAPCGEPHRAGPPGPRRAPPPGRERRRPDREHRLDRGDRRHRRDRRLHGEQARRGRA